MVLKSLLQVLLDPVCCMIIHPTLLTNFVYKPPAWRNLSSVKGCVDSARYLFSRDLVISAVRS